MTQDFTTKLMEEISGLKKDFLEAIDKARAEAFEKGFRAGYAKGTHDATKIETKDDTDKPYSPF